MTTLKFLGHSCFLLSDERTSILFDPFLTDNPFRITRATDIHCDYILPSHAHFDHLGDTVEIAKRCGATVVSTAEVAHLCSEQGCKTHGMHIGGKHTFDFGFVRLTIAFHGAGVPGGLACGFIVKMADITIYHAGDTALFSDMALLGKLEPIHYALLPIGDNFTMGPDDAVEAAGLLKPRTVIPMHYNTWPLINQSPQEYKRKVEERFGIPVQILEPGQYISCIP